MVATTEVALPIGLWSGGARAEQAVLRPMTGADQEFFVEAGHSMLPAHRTSVLLSRCVQRIGDEAPVTPEVAGRLVVGDREALMLRLRQITFGDKLEPIIRCPEPACGQQMEVPLRVADLLVERSNDLPEYFERSVPGLGAFRFRLPCGRDQEAVSAVAQRDPHAAALTLLARCTERAVDDLPSGAVQSIGAWMAELDRQAEIRLELTCPECRHAFTSLLDAGTYLFEETALRAGELYWQVHFLASHYHWSEAEILGMTPPKRKRYIDLLLDALG
jgi:hypothetical protein